MGWQGDGGRKGPAGIFAERLGCSDAAPQLASACRRAVCGSGQTDSESRVLETPSTLTRHSVQRRTRRRIEALLERGRRQIAVDDAAVLEHQHRRAAQAEVIAQIPFAMEDRKSTRLNSSH